MKVNKLLKLINMKRDIVIYGVGNPDPAYEGFVSNIPFYLTKMKVVEVQSGLGDDGYHKLAVVVERDVE